MKYYLLSHDSERLYETSDYKIVFHAMFKKKNNKKLFSYFFNTEKGKIDFLKTIYSVHNLDFEIEYYEKNKKFKNYHNESFHNLFEVESNYSKDLEMENLNFTYKEYLDDVMKKIYEKGIDNFFDKIKYIPDIGCRNVYFVSENELKDTIFKILVDMDQFDIISKVILPE